MTSFSVCSRTPRILPFSLPYSPCSVSSVPAGQKPQSHLPSDFNTVAGAAYMLPLQSHDASQTPPPSRLGARLHDATNHDAAGALAGARRRSDVTRSNGIDTPTHSPLCATMTSSIIPEVDNVSQQRRQRRTTATRPDNNSTYRVAMHNTKTWPISAACGTFHTPFYVEKDDSYRGRGTVAAYASAGISCGPVSVCVCVTSRATLSICWALRTSPCRGPNPSVDRRVRWIPSDMLL